MNKTVKTILIAFVVVALLVAVAYAVLVVNGKPKTNLEPVTSGDDLVALVDKIYEGQGELYSSLMTQVVDVTDNDSVPYFTGLENGENLEYLAVSEPMMMSQAYSLVLAKVKDGVDANVVAKEMSENIDTRKWICVTAEKLYATSSGDVVFLIMTNEEMATPVYEKFKTLAGNVNEVYEKTEEESKTVVAKVEGKEITAEELFNKMDRVSGITIALSELTYQRFLNNTEINKFYNVETKEWLDKDVKEDIEDQIATEKDNFKKGTYVEYGYDPKEMSFDDFIDVVYSAKSEEDLLLLFLYSTVVKDYTNSLLDVAVKENKEYVESKVWPLVEGKMKESLSKYFNVKGVHLLVCAYEDTLDYINGGQIVDPSKWSENQKQLYLWEGTVKDYNSQDKEIR